ncbi:uncharacterized protein LOC110066318 [Orbicella faveolata]|uniref:uncharacterized protein LOC110066318 n=1 Tax=Orbicella faveolata TaxID=48498 RepID=UPI0009E2B877|nr:uncharacterized protein LOC110066318 [Orbicella faveolata]
MAAVPFKGNPTRRESRRLKRKEKQDELGVCRIRRTTGDQRSQTLGSGFVVKNLQIFPDLDFYYCLISSGKAFPKDDCNIESYYLDFKKLDSSELKTIKLTNVAANPANFVRTSGLVVIPIKPSKECHKDESIFDYRPFTVINAGIAPGVNLKCYFVDDGPGQTNFSVIGLELKRSETVPTQFQLLEGLERPYTTYDELTCQGNRKPYGAVILKKRGNNEFLAVGALTFTDNECRNITSAFFPLRLADLVTQTSEPFSGGNEYPVPVSEQQVSVDNAPSIEVESPGMASTETSESVPDGNEDHVSEQQPPANNVTSTDGSQVTSTAALKVRIDVDTMKPAEQCNTQDRTVSTIESKGSRDGEHQEASAGPVPSGHTQPLCTGAEAHQAPMSPTDPEKVLCLIATNYLQAKPFRCESDCDDFLAYMREMRLIITGVYIGSLLITVKCNSLEILERLWEDYLSGHFGEVAQRCLVTEEILTELSLAELKLKTTISEEEYKAYKKYLGKDPAGETDETYDGDDSASDDEGT